MNVDYDLIYHIYVDLLEKKAIFYIISGTKFLAISILLISWYRKYFQSMDGKLNIPIKPKDIVNGLLLVTAITIFDQILDWLDALLGSIENTYRGFEAEPKTSDPFLEEALEKDASLSKVWYHLTRFAEDPTYFILKIAEYFVWFIDTFIYGVFLAERFFFLGIVRIFGAFALAFASIPELKKWFTNWISVYVALYLMVIPFFFVNAFTNAIFTGIYAQAGEHLITKNGLGMIMTIVLVFVAWIKLRLYKKIHNLIFRIFN